jgi:nitrite reductase (NADH) small subunit
LSVRLCAVDDVPLGEGRETRIAGEPLAVFRAPGGWFATQARCPHLGGPLADGIVADRSVICPLHERRFDLATGRPLGHDCPALRTRALAVRDGVVWLADG